MIPTWPVQQVEIEMISAETGEARLASPRDAVSRHVSGPHFGDQEYAVALTGNHAADQFLGAAVAVHLRRVDQRHAERKARAQRFFLSGFRMSSLREMPEPWPSAGTMVPSGNFTVRPAAADIDVLDSAAVIAPAAQSPVNSRRLSNGLFTSSIFMT